MAAPLVQLYSVFSVGLGLGYGTLIQCAVFALDYLFCFMSYNLCQDGVRAADWRKRVFYRRAGEQRHENSPLCAQRPPAPSGGHRNF